MTLSLNETHKLVKDASRGSGFSWGEADELAHVAVWLEVAGQNGAGLAVSILADFTKQRVSGVALKRDKHWRLSPRHTPAPPQMSALTAGITARDLLNAEIKNKNSVPRVTMKSVRCPMVALGLLAGIDVPDSASLIATTSGANSQTQHTLIRRNTDVYISSIPDEGPQDIDAIIRPDDSNLGQMHHIWSPRRNRTACEHGVVPSADALSALRKLAHNCLVPATEESRLKGAGAGTVDRD